MASHTLLFSGNICGLMEFVAWSNGQKIAQVCGCPALSLPLYKATAAAVQNWKSKLICAADCETNHFQVVIRNRHVFAILYLLWAFMLFFFCLCFASFFRKQLLQMCGWAGYGCYGVWEQIIWRYFTCSIVGVCVSKWCVDFCWVGENFCGL